MNNCNVDDHQRMLLEIKRHCIDANWFEVSALLESECLDAERRWLVDGQPLLHFLTLLRAPTALFDKAILCGYSVFDHEEILGSGSILELLLRESNSIADWPQMFRSALKAGADPNGSSSGGERLLEIALKRDLVAAVEMLVDYGARAQNKNFFGEESITALDLASELGNAAAKRLLELTVAN